MFNYLVTLTRLPQAIKTAPPQTVGDEKTIGCWQSQSTNLPSENNNFWVIPIREKSRQSFIQMFDAAMYKWLP